jgi:GT2 family glycosyltransferase
MMVETSRAPGHASGPSEEPPAGPGLVARIDWYAEAPSAAPAAADVTVVVCTYRRPESFGRLLDSLASQSVCPAHLVIVDASPEAATEHVLTARADRHRLARRLTYVRVEGALRGLTRQRELALRYVDTPLTAFCDDDVEMRSDCLEELREAHRRLGAELAGAAPFIENEYQPPSRRWIWRRRLGIVPDLVPGRYHASGVSVPWRFQPRADTPVEGDWLPGCVTMWRTEVPRRIGFATDFAGYGNGEDLEFSLRAREMGRLVMVGRAVVVHHRDPGNRPEGYEFGYMTARNASAIHHRAFPGPRRGLRERAWYAYASACETLVLAADALLRPESRGRIPYLRGRIRFLAEQAGLARATHEASR